MILVTGSNGLIGTALTAHLCERGYGVRGFDIARSSKEDTRDRPALETALEDVEGVVHLAAVSRVVWAQRDPKLAQSVNVEALRSLLAAVSNQKVPPWLVFASSREVYGEAQLLPVGEDAPFAPLNAYARTKVAGEALANEARKNGLLVNIVRFSNVYGSASDHPDRLVPAYARTAASGGILRLEGPENMFDLTHVDDVTRGLARLVEATAVKEALPPIHFVSGQGTTLEQLATMASRNSGHCLELEVTPSRNYDVGRFVGDPARARALLGWGTKISIEQGFEMLAAEFRNVSTAATTAGVAASPAAASASA